MNKKIRTMGLVLMGLAVLMTGCKSGRWKRRQHQLQQRQIRKKRQISWVMHC